MEAVLVVVGGGGGEVVCLNQVRWRETGSRLQRPLRLAYADCVMCQIGLSQTLMDS